VQSRCILARRHGRVDGTVGYVPASVVYSGWSAGSGARKMARRQKPLLGR
jgi:hypothetical protein